ncbi:MAG: hypothetical protein WA993_00520 [Candidatus Binatus sp.]|jgi:hypothetical protein|uniref:hypothetical protein n=1 Tax=Candidatus Binatus sp. TaxID=2811406 RepID=UPI003C9D288F
MRRHPRADFSIRADGHDDELFYSALRLVVDLDDGAIAKLGAIVIHNLDRAARSQSHAPILDLTRSFMQSGAFENIDFTDASTPAAPLWDDVWAVAGRKTSRQQARRRPGETDDA